MGTRTATAEEVQAALEMIKGQMPETYKCIQAKAALVGKMAFALVRRGIKGEVNCFWACERGLVTGTPFADSEIERDIAQLMVQFGSTFVCIWGKEAASGPN
jgi:hypothetical protein